MRPWVDRGFQHVARLLRPPVRALRSEWSAISTAEDLLPQPSDRVLDLSLAMIDAARGVDLSEIAKRCNQDQRAWLTLWPGEHYRLLSALAAVIRPKLAVEIGTFTGMGCLSLLHGGHARRVVTYDLVGWQSQTNCLLERVDFDSHRLEQRLGDLSDPDYFSRERETLRNADLIFIDGPKDGLFERSFFELLMPAIDGSWHVLLLDDIRFLNMLQLWRDLPVPKLDLTSFGHWSGTGLAVVEGPGSPPWARQ